MHQMQQMQIDGWLAKTPYFTSERVASEAPHAANAFKIECCLFYL